MYAVLSHDIKETHEQKKKFILCTESNSKNADENVLNKLQWISVKVDGRSHISFVVNAIQEIHSIIPHFCQFQIDSIAH